MKTVDKLENDNQIYKHQQNSILSQFTQQNAPAANIQLSSQNDG
jgi:hypothetical protein